MTGTDLLLMRGGGLLAELGWIHVCLSILFRDVRPGWSETRGDATESLLLLLLLVLKLLLLLLHLAKRIHLEWATLISHA